MKTNFLGASYESRSLPLAAQTLVNMFYEPAPPGSADEGMFYGSPGLKLFAEVGVGPIRGAAYAHGSGWVVSGQKFYQVTWSGAATEIGDVPGSGRVHILSNDTQIVVMHSLGWHVLTLRGWTYGYVPESPTTAQGTYQDSYIVFPNVNGTYGWTNIGNAQFLDALNFASAEAQPDPIIAVISDHRELWLFGEQTVEIAQTSGDPDLAFTRTAMVEYGCAAKYTPAKSDNTVFWVGRNEAGQGVVYRADGYSPVRISTHALETALMEYGDLSEAWGYCYQQNGHTFYVLTVPGKATWAYDASTNRWTRLAYLNPATGALEQHRGNAYMFLKGMHIVGDRESGKLYRLDLNVFTDDGDPIYRERAWAVIENTGKMIRHNRIELFAEMGVGLDGAQFPGTTLVYDENGEPITDELGNPLLDEADPGVPSVGGDPYWELDWSDDGCRTYSNKRRLYVGRMGEYRNRAVLRRLGVSRRRVYRISTSEPVRIAVYGANLDATAMRR